MASNQSQSDIIVKIDNVIATKLDEKAHQSSAVNFNIKVNMDEIERKTQLLVVHYAIIMNTEPSVAKFQVEGSAVVKGRLEDIEEAVSSDPQTNVPYLFTKVYQQVYPVLFMLAGAIDIPYPSPGLLRSPKPTAQVAETVQR